MLDESNAISQASIEVLDSEHEKMCAPELFVQQSVAQSSMLAEYVEMGPARADSHSQIYRDDEFLMELEEFIGPSEAALHVLKIPRH